MPAILFRVQSGPQSTNSCVVDLNASHACQSVSVIVCPESYLAYAARIFFISGAHGDVVSPLWYSGVTQMPTAAGPCVPLMSAPTVSVTRLNPATTQRG